MNPSVLPTPAERELLVNCARLGQSPELDDRTTVLLCGRMDWQRILAYAEAHSVAGLLRLHVDRLAAWDAVPLEARRRLLQLVHRAAYRNRLYTEALSELLNAFVGAGVPVMVLKGLALAELVYQNLSLRPLIDLNLLVPVNRVPDARRLLARGGYQETISGRSSFYRWCHSQIVFVKPGEFAAHVVLQWGVVTWPRVHAIDLGRFWQDARPAILSGVETRIPSPTDFVLYLCLQADKYAYANRVGFPTGDLAGFVLDELSHNRLIRFTDLHETMRRYDAALDRGQLLERARSSAIEDSVYASVVCAERLFSPAAPSLLKGVPPTRPRAARRLLYRAIFSPAGRTVQSSDERRFRRWWLSLGGATQRRWIRVLDLLEYVFPRRHELRRHHEVFGRPGGSAGYLLHVGSALARCALHVPSWVMHRGREQLYRMQRPARKWLRSPVLGSQPAGPS